MRVKDLPAPRPHTSVTGLDGKISKVWTRQPIMYCRQCRGEYSANPVNYTTIMNPDHELTCCRVELLLVDKHIVYQRVVLENSDRVPLGGNDVC